MKLFDIKFSDVTDKVHEFQVASKCGWIINRYLDFEGEEMVKNMNTRLEKYQERAQKAYLELREEVGYSENVDQLAQERWTLIIKREIDTFKEQCQKDIEDQFSWKEVTKDFSEDRKHRMIEEILKSIEEWKKQKQKDLNEQASEKIKDMFQSLFKSNEKIKI